MAYYLTSLSLQGGFILLQALNGIHVLLQKSKNEPFSLQKRLLILLLGRGYSTSRCWYNHQTTYGIIHGAWRTLGAWVLLALVLLQAGTSFLKIIIKICRVFILNHGIIRIWNFVTFQGHTSWHFHSIEAIIGTIDLIIFIHIIRNSCVLFHKS